MVASITRIVPITRNQGVQVPGLVQFANWIDSLILAAGVAQTYALPVDANGNVGTILRLSSNGGPLYINFAGTAIVPIANTTNGASSGILRTDLGPVLIAVPDGKPNPSIICPSNAIVTIEAWR